MQELQQPLLDIAGKKNTPHLPHPPYRWSSLQQCREQQCCLGRLLAFLPRSVGDSLQFAIRRADRDLVAKMFSLAPVLISCKSWLAVTAPSPFEELAAFREGELNEK